jgi:hypothetical protein
MPPMVPMLYRPRRDDERRPGRPDDGPRATSVLQLHSGRTPGTRPDAGEGSREMGAAT